jgi:hypothetical protein
MKADVIILAVSALLLSCMPREKQASDPFPVLDVYDADWAIFEGRWVADDGILHMELSLQITAFGEANYKLRESFESKTFASGTTSQGRYSRYYGLPDNETGIRLHDLSEYNKGVHWRIKASPYLNTSDDMYFVTRGNNELIPCDDLFKPATTNSRHTLHKRSKLFTVEGYITFESDSAQFYERNTMEYWVVRGLGEFNELKRKYEFLATERYEGVYLRALAYTVVNPEVGSKKEALVIKRIMSMGKDPEQD